MSKSLGDTVPDDDKDDDDDVRDDDDVTPDDNDVEGVKIVRGKLSESRMTGFGASQYRATDEEKIKTNILSRPKSDFVVFLRSEIELDTLIMTYIRPIL